MQIRFRKTRALCSSYRLPVMAGAVSLLSVLAAAEDSADEPDIGEDGMACVGQNLTLGECASGERVYINEYESSDSVRGYIVEIYDDDTLRCDSYISLVGSHLWSRSTQAFLYGIGLLYCFLGVAIIADIFMAAIEVITSVEREIDRKNPVTGEMETVTVLVWNPTVANLSLMALGSSAPEILLAVIGTISTLDETPDELGPGTIVGSAAFNLLVITAVCVVGIPNNETRVIKETGVFAITASFSVLSYLWLFAVLSDDVVKPWEAWFTFLMFPVLVVLAWAADNGWFGLCRGGGGGGPNVSDAPDLGDTQLVQINIQTTGGDDLIADHDTIRAVAKQLKMEQGVGVDDAAISDLVARQERPPSRMKYRMNAIRAMTGRRRAIPIKSAPKEESKAPELDDGVPTVRFEFRSPTYAIIESGGACVCTVVRTGVLDCAAEVSYATRDGTATANEDYVPISDGKLMFAAGEEAKELSVTIIDDDEWEPDETLFVTLSAPSAAGGAKCVLGATAEAQITILNDDSPGVLSFASAGKFPCKESDGSVEITVLRKNGSDGVVTVEYSTQDGTALNGRDYQATAGTITFESGETSQTVSIPIVDNDKDEEAFNDFTVVLTNVAPEGAKLSALKVATVTIYHDDAYTGMVDKVAGVMKMRAKLFSTATHGWREQFTDALTMSGEVTESGEELPPSTMDFVMHALTMPWKIVFAMVPPSSWHGGWTCFFSALFAIGILTGIIGELAALFGCAIGLETSITAITFVALGTSLPDTFASKTAAAQDAHADASIGNVTGSNSVNVLLGLGLPWVIATLYKGGDYDVPAGDLAYSVVIFVTCATICLLTLVARRFLVGGELGGEGNQKYVTAAFFVSMWLVYVILVSIKATS